MPSDEVSATQLIDDLTDSLVAYVKGKLAERIRKKKKPSSMYRGGDVYTFGDHGAGYVVLVEDEEIVYFLRHELVKANSFRLGRQVLVWRNKDAPSYASSGFAKKIFFDYLLPKYKALISDQHQTNQGMAFWQYALDLAFDRGDLHAYFLDRRSTPNRLTELFNTEDVLKFKRELWGTSEGHTRTFAVISSVPLKLKDQP